MDVVECLLLHWLLPAVNFSISPLIAYVVVYQTAGRLKYKRSLPCTFCSHYFLMSGVWVQFPAPLAPCGFMRLTGWPLCKAGCPQLFSQLPLLVQVGRLLATACVWLL